MIAIEGTARLNAKIFGVFFKEPSRGKDGRGDVMRKGWGDIELVEVCPDAVVLVGALCLEDILHVWKHEVGHAGKVVGGGGVHVAHDDDVGRGEGREEGIDTGLEDGLGDSAFPFRLGSASKLRGKVADEKVEGVAWLLDSNGRECALDVENVASGGGRQGNRYGFAVKNMEAGRVIEQGNVYAAFVGALIMDVFVPITA